MQSHVAVWYQLYTMDKPADVSFDTIKSDSVSPPPPPTGISMREWFAGLALGNPELMKDVPHSSRVATAVRIADELMKTLATSKVPSRESLEPPTEKQLEVWEEKIKVDSQRTVSQRKETIPAFRRPIIPPANQSVDDIKTLVKSASQSFKAAVDIMKTGEASEPDVNESTQRSPSVYSIVRR